MKWTPNEKESLAIQNIQSMCLGSALGDGVESRDVFTNNLRMMAEYIDELPPTEGKVTG